jgi:hypothetical protein
MSAMIGVTRPSPMPSVIEPPSDALASPRVKRSYIAAPRGSAMPIRTSFFFSRRYSDTPATVPPVPIEQMKPSTFPSVSSQISGPVER